ncbi:unnamed protein product [Echinostoma caproni]|uniref:Uncharacterized protein n=1 Tax=Echinostoma caproni TaxID=27848 RepID=A0A183A9H5_9TREM|nr:unnamed protein product [Echinostoma caproni]
MEQIANCVTHVPLVPLSIFGLVRLYGKATSWAQCFAAVVYGTAVCCLFLASSSFHLCSLLAHDRLLDLFSVIAPTFEPEQSYF